MDAPRPKLPTEFCRQLVRQQTEPDMSRIPDQVADRESCGRNSGGFAAALQVLPGYRRSWMPALAALLMAASVAQGQAGLAIGVTGADAGSGIIPTTTTLGSSTTNTSPRKPSFRQIGRAHV